MRHAEDHKKHNSKYISNMKFERKLDEIRADEVWILKLHPLIARTYNSRSGQMRPFRNSINVHNNVVGPLLTPSKSSKTPINAYPNMTTTSMANDGHPSVPRCRVLNPRSRNNLKLEKWTSIGWDTSGWSMSFKTSSKHISSISGQTGSQDTFPKSAGIWLHRGGPWK